MPNNRRGFQRGRRGKAVHLETVTLAQIRANKDNSERLCNFHWNFYSELAIQRSKIEDKLSETLSRSAIENYQFERWQRVVRYKHSLMPLSSAGSLKFGGGRFNIGDIDPNRFPMFPSLYLAENKETALQEVLGQEKTTNGLTPMDLALTRADSITIVSVSGMLESVFDLTKEHSLKEFLEVTSKFEVSKQLKDEAKRLKLPSPIVVQTEDDLLKAIMYPEWRQFPQIVDVPANPQIFGQLVRSAQLCGILYFSKFNGAKCLALFPKNFKDTISFIQLDDAVPNPEVLIRIDSSNGEEIEK